MLRPPHPLITVNPGDPLKSEDWNNLVAAISRLYEAHNAPRGSIVVRVREQKTELPIPGAAVTLIPRNERKGRVCPLAWAGGVVRRHLGHDIPPGDYVLVAEATGFDTEERDVVVEAGNEPLSLDIGMSMVKPTITMVNLFGMPLKEAVSTLKEVHMEISRIIDSHGNEIPPGNIGDQNDEAVVLNQVPEAGMRVPLSTGVRLHIAAKAEFKEKIKVPDLSGLTLAEAEAVLAAAGLVAGTTSNLKMGQ